jgi:pyruvyltransferase
MKFVNIKNIIFDKFAGLYFIPYLFSLRGHAYVSFAIPRYKKGNYNWGDDVNFFLGEKLTGKKIIPYRYSFFKHRNYLMIGSVIQWYCNSKSIIWGAGLLHKVDSIKEKPEKVLAVRGPLTRDSLLKCGVDCPEVYGDPALLFPLFYKPDIEKKYKIGIIFHFSEVDKVNIPTPKNTDKKHILFININKYGAWNNFIDQILSCETILSSSLHGIIISEAYNIPNLWTVFSLYSASQSTFKYQDFYLSINKNIDQPYTYENLLLIDDLISFILKNYSLPSINIKQLIDSCPFQKGYSKLMN